MALNWKTSIFAKNLRALYKVNLNKSNETHQVVIQAIFDTFVMVGDDIDKAKLEMSILTATGKWLDYWGDFFNVHRDVGESDEDYSQRIIDEVIAPKVTMPALQLAAARWLNRKYGDNWKSGDITIFEPWTRLLKPSQRGTLSGDAKLWSADYWRYAVIDIFLPDMSKLTIELINYLNTIKAAGVKIIWSIKPNWSVIVGTLSEYKAYAKYKHNRHLRVRPMYPSLMVFPPYHFLGDDDSFYSGTISGDKTVSAIGGKQLIHTYPIIRSKDLQTVWFKIRDWHYSSVTVVEDFAWLSEKKFSDSTVHDMLLLESNNIWAEENSAAGKFLPLSVGDIATSLGKPWEQVTVQDIIDFYSALENSRLRNLIITGKNVLDILTDIPNLSIDTITVQDIINYENTLKIMEYLNHDTGILTRSQGSIEVTSVPLTNMYITLANEQRYYKGSPIFDILINEGYIFMSDGSTMLLSGLNIYDVLSMLPYLDDNTITAQDLINFESELMILKGDLEQYWYRERWGNFMYPDFKRFSFSWITLLDMVIHLGGDPEITSLEDIENNKKTLIIELIKENTIISNLQLPVQVTTISI